MSRLGPGDPSADVGRVDAFGPAIQHPGDDTLGAPEARRTGRTVVATALAGTLPVPVAREVVVAQGSSAVVAGGLLAGDVSSRRVFRFTPGRRPATAMPPLAQPLHDSAGARLNGRLLVVGGGGATELSAVQHQDQRSRWHVGGHLPRPRSDLSVVATPGALLVIGGYDGVRSDRQVLRTVDGHRFTAFARLRHGVRYAAAVGLGSAVWVFGGEDQGRQLRSVERIDTRTGAVTAGPRLPRAVGHSAAAVVGSRILILGGRLGPRQVSDRMWWFDPRSGTYTAAGRLPYPVADAGVVTLSGAVYLLGGETPGLTDRVIRVAQRR